MAADHYGVLGLPSGIEGAKLSDEEIKKCYKRKLLEVHPDKGKTKSAESFIALKSSYEVLTNMKKRKKLDQELLKEQEQKKRKKLDKELRKEKERKKLEEEELRKQQERMEILELLRKQEEEKRQKRAKSAELREQMRIKSEFDSVSRLMQFKKIAAEAKNKKAQEQAEAARVAAFEANKRATDLAADEFATELEMKKARYQAEAATVAAIDANKRAEELAEEARVAAREALAASDFPSFMDQYRTKLRSQSQS